MVAASKSDRERAAEAAMVAICAQLALTGARNEDFEIWLDTLNKVLPDCEHATLEMVNLRTAAWRLCNAKPGPARSNAFSRLHFEVHVYYLMAASGRFEAWKEKCGGQV